MIIRVALAHVMIAVFCFSIIDSQIVATIL
jgi:hypothetical protein